MTKTVNYGSPFPDLGERSKNDPMYLISSSDVLRIIIAREGVSRALNKTQADSIQALRKCDITEEMLNDIVAEAREQGWRAAVTAGKQILLSSEEIVTGTEKNKLVYDLAGGTRKKAFVTFGAAYNLLGILNLPHGDYVIENPRVEGFMVSDDTLVETLGQRFLDVSDSPYNGFQLPMEGNRRELILRYRNMDAKPFNVKGSLNQETGNVALDLEDTTFSGKFLGTLLSFDLREPRRDY
jgi:hypothetical protein